MVLRPKGWPFEIGHVHRGVVETPRGKTVDFGLNLRQRIYLARIPGTDIVGRASDDRAERPRIRWKGV
jgi:hypothetical protein